MRGTLTRFTTWAKPQVACTDGPADIPILQAILFFLGFLVNVVMSCSIGTTMESSRASKRLDAGITGLEDMHRHEDVHGDGVSQSRESPSHFSKSIDAGSCIFASTHPSDHK